MGQWRLRTLASTHRVKIDRNGTPDLLSYTIMAYLAVQQKINNKKTKYHKHSSSTCLLNTVNDEHIVCREQQEHPENTTVIPWQIWVAAAGWNSGVYNYVSCLPRHSGTTTFSSTQWQPEYMLSPNRVDIDSVAVWRRQEMLGHPQIQLRILFACLFVCSYPFCVLVCGSLPRKLM